MSDPEEPKEAEEPNELEQPAATEEQAAPAEPSDVEQPTDPEQPAEEESAEAEPPLELAEGGIALKRIAEALVFASPKPITTKEIVAALKAAAEGSEDPHIQALGKSKAAHVVAALGEVQEELVATSRAFQLVEKLSGWVLVSDPACAAWVRQLYPEAKPTRLTGPQLETLAIIAYRQPVTRADIEAVRGVSVDGVMQVLLDRSLVKIAGRAEVPGRPLLYSTTDYFLEHFGLKNTDELPNATELKRVVLPTAPVPEEAAKAEAAPAEATAAAPEGATEVPVEAAETPSESAPTEEPESSTDEAPVEEAPELEEPTVVTDEAPEPEPTEEPPAEPRD